MNHPSTGTLDARQVTHLTADLRAMLTDIDTGLNAVVSTPQSQGVDLVTGQAAEALAVDAVTGWGGPLTRREIASAGGFYETGDMRLVVMAGDLSATPGTHSRFRIDTTDYAVVHAERDALLLAWHLVGRPNH